MRQPCIALEPHLTFREAAQVMSDAGISTGTRHSRWQLAGHRIGDWLSDERVCRQHRIISL